MLLLLDLIHSGDVWEYTERESILDHSLAGEWVRLNIIYPQSVILFCVYFLYLFNPLRISEKMGSPQ